MKRRSSHVLRQILAFMTVLAAFVFQLRTDALGGMTPPASVSVTELQVMLAQGTHCGERQPAERAQHAQHPRPSAPPSDPHAGHGAHCPFCLSNAFALEAGIVGLPQGPPDFLPQPVPSASFCVAASVRHADARAPPFSLKA